MRRRASAPTAPSEDYELGYGFGRIDGYREGARDGAHVGAGIILWGL